MSGWPFRAQDCSSTSRWEGQLSAVLSVKDGTGLSVRSFCSGLGFALKLFVGLDSGILLEVKGKLVALLSGRENRAQCLLKLHSQAKVLWAETGTTGPTVMCFPHSLQAPCSYAGLCERKWQL